MSLLGCNPRTFSVWEKHLLYLPLVHSQNPSDSGLCCPHRHDSPLLPPSFGVQCTCRCPRLRFMVLRLIRLIDGLWNLLTQCQCVVSNTAIFLDHFPSILVTRI